MKQTIFAALLTTSLGLSAMAYSITTIAPEQPSTAYLEQEAKEVGFDRAWLIAVKDDPIIQKTIAETQTATPQQARSSWLKAANEQAERGKANEIIYCLYRRRPFLQQWSTAPFVWASFIDLGERMHKRPNKTVPRNPASIAIAKNNADLIETVMPKDALFIKQIANEPQALVCQLLIQFLTQAITLGSIPITSILLNRIKAYDLWDHEVVKKLKSGLIQAAGNNQEMLQFLHNEGLKT